MSEDIEKIAIYGYKHNGDNLLVKDCLGDFYKISDVKPFLDELERLRESTRWISVRKEGNPKEKGLYLVKIYNCNDRDIYVVTEWNGESWWHYEGLVYAYQKIALLPEPPTEDAK